ncbi:MAG: hypothetical protein Q7T20_10450 [Saprospiraceae bacterium]|nr:hypothetical protein [Saprospiraceae bacterium]
MKNTPRIFLTWFPRILALIFAGFISLFALDSMEAHQTFFQQMGHILAHLVPTAAVLAALWLAWYRRIIGGLVFMMLGMVFTIHFATWRQTGLFLMFSMPLFITGVMFIFSRYSQLQSRNKKVDKGL